MRQVTTHKKIQTVLAIATLAWTCQCAAMYRFVTLAELTRDADIVAIVTQEKNTAELSRGPDKSRHVITRALKGGNVGGEILMCPQRNSEAYDFTDGPTLFVLFAKKKRRCFEPLVGRRGVVEIEGEQAYTVNFLGEPNWQSLSDFIQKAEQEVLRTNRQGKNTRTHQKPKVSDPN